MKRPAILGFLWLIPMAASCANKPQIFINVPYAAQVNETFQANISLVPPSDEPVTVVMEKNASLSFSQTSFRLKGSEVRSVEVKVKSSPRAGLLWINAHGNGGYDDGWSVVDVDFDGHLKSSGSEPITYDKPATLTLLILDKEQRPIPFLGDLELTLESSDGILTPSAGGQGKEQAKPLKITVPGFSRSTPQFQIKALSALGGTVHLSAVLTVPGYSHVLAQEQFVFDARPAWWVPVVLAIFGGLLHAMYKMVRTPPQSSTGFYPKIVLVVTSCIAAFVGYLFAEYDLLGLKLDPNVLRTYAIVGFLFSYFGIEGLLSDKLANVGRKGQALRSTEDQASQ